MLWYPCTLALFFCCIWYSHVYWVRVWCVCRVQHSLCLIREVMFVSVICVSQTCEEFQFRKWPPQHKLEGHIVGLSICSFLFLFSFWWLGREVVSRIVLCTYCMPSLFSSLHRSEVSHFFWCQFILCAFHFWFNLLNFSWQKNSLICCICLVFFLCSKLQMLCQK